MLAGRGVVIVPPEEGRLAGGDIGKGRLADPATVVDAVIALFADGPLDGRSVLISAGGTREPIDPVRFLGNRSSGKQGHALAEVAAAMGAKVTLVTTAGLPSSPTITRVDVETAAQMHEAIAGRAPTADIVIMAAAVADFRPVGASTQKIKKADGTPTVTLERTVDILGGLGAGKPSGQVLVGFAAETENMRDNALGKARTQGCRPTRCQRCVRPRRRIRPRYECGDHLRLRRVGTGNLLERQDCNCKGGARRCPGAVARHRKQKPVNKNFTFTSESVTEGHPDKMADQISDAILDAIARAGSAEPGGMRDHGHHRVGHRRRRDFHLGLRRHPVGGSANDHPDRLRHRDLRLRRQDLRCDGGHRRAVGRHRPGCRQVRRGPHRDGQWRRLRRAGRRGPGHDVRLRLQRDRRLDAAADPPGTQDGRTVGRGPAGRHRSLPPPRRQDPGHLRLRRRQTGQPQDRAHLDPTR